MKIYMKYSFNDEKNNGTYAFLIADNDNIITQEARETSCLNKEKFKQEVLMKALEKLPANTKKVEIFSSNLNDKKCSSNESLMKSLSSFSYVFKLQKEINNPQIISTLRKLIKDTKNPNAEQSSSPQGKTKTKTTSKTPNTNETTKTTQPPTANNNIKTTQTPTKTLENTIKIYTDGSLRKAEDIGVGGWSFLIESKTHTIMSNGVLFCDSNHLAELMAVIKALQALENFEVKEKVFIHTDSQYVVDRIDPQYVIKYVSDNREKSIEIKEFEEQWNTLNPLLEKYKPSISWVKGHNGHEQNELCDQMAGEVTESFTQANPQDLAKAKLDEDLANETSKKLAQLTSQNLDETLANETSKKLEQLEVQNLETIKSFSTPLKNFANNLTENLRKLTGEVDKNTNNLTKNLEELKEQLKEHVDKNINNFTINLRKLKGTVTKNITYVREELDNIIKNLPKS